MDGHLNATARLHSPFFVIACEQVAKLLCFLRTTPRSSQGCVTSSQFSVLIVGRWQAIPTST